jgi:hypothetical protein
MGEQSGEKTDLIGMLGELLFAKMFNVYPDLSLEPRRGGVDGVLDGFRYDVKATDLRAGRLLVPVDKVRLQRSELPEVYALVVLDGPAGHCAGFAWIDEILREDRIMNLGHGPTHALSQRSLWQWEERTTNRQGPPMARSHQVPLFDPTKAFG